MKKKELIVKIPIRFKKNLIKRFSASNFVYLEKEGWMNKTPCKICIEYFKIDAPKQPCKKCPFRSFINIFCLTWIKKIHPLMKYLFIDHKFICTPSLMSRRELRKILKEFKEKAIKHIRWI